MTLVSPAVLLTLAAAHPGWWSIILIVAAAYFVASAFIPKLENHQ